jgi:hypothetical protein
MPGHDVLTGHGIDHRRMVQARPSKRDQLLAFVHAKEIIEQHGSRPLHPRNHPHLALTDLNHRSVRYAQGFNFVGDRRATDFKCLAR